MENELIPAFTGLRVIECNLSHFRSKRHKGKDGLPSAKQKTEVFETLIELLTPKLIVTFGSHARKHFDKDSANKGEFVTRTVRNVTLEVFLADHLIMGGAVFWQGDRFETLGQRARQICSEQQ